MNDTSRLDWTQWLYPGPRRVFTPEEMARAGGQPWPKGLDYYVLGNVLLLVLIFYNRMPRGVAPVVLVAVAVSWSVALSVARWLWQHPTRQRLSWVSTALAFLAGLGAFLASRHLDRELVMVALPFAAAELALVLSGWGFLTLYRVQQIEARLRELDDQAQHVKLAQRLATAQIQPHFLFNTLASLQHWVDTRDERAGPTLRSLTRYLRATLPLFEQDRLPLEQELHIVRSYLEIMQARLGQRLAWTLDVAPGLPPASLPPGALLTLAENAITHGIEPSLRGGGITITVALSASGRLRLEVRDDGHGLPPGACDGLGLTNTRERLRAQFGAAAQLGLEPAQPGCRAWMDIPVDDAGAPAPIATAAPATATPSA